MWNIGDKNMEFKGQMAGYGPAGIELPSVQSRSFPPPTGRSDKLFSAESAGETNFRIGHNISDDASSLFRGNLGDNGQTMSDGKISQHELQMANTQQEIHISTDKGIQFTKPNMLWSQYGSYQFSDLNSFPSNFQAKNVNFLKSGLNNTETMFRHAEPSSQNSTSVREFSQLSSSQHLMYGLSSPAEAGKLLPYANEGAGSRENVPKDVTNLTLRNFLPPNSSSFGPRNASYGNKKPTESSQSWMGKTEVGSHAENYNGRNFCGDISFIGTSSEAVKDGYNMDVAGIPSASLSITAPPQTSAAGERNQAHRSHHGPTSEVESSHYPRGDGDANFHANVQENNESDMLDKPSDCTGELLDYSRLKRSPHEVHASKLADDSDNENGNSTLKAEASQEIGRPVNKTSAPRESQASLGRDSTSNLPSVKVTPTITKKLWEGTLQLNTSTAVSAVAVFKSGEKVSEVNWSKHVEVKGKVRLEAFEKFVQELPRSRTRALMVISIYWKVGSSESGLMGMKEVAKGYKEGQRVGFAQLCPGIDLYVCPRSDAIITILAKYGFFKGMAAVEEDQNSLIGCVVWRRNHPSTDVALKKTEKKEFPYLEQPFDSPSKSAISNNGDQNSSILKTTDSEHNQVIPTFKVPTEASSTLKSLAPDNGNTDETKNIKSTNVPISVINGKNNAAPSIPSVIPQLPMSVQQMETPLEDLSKCTSHSTTLFRHDAAQKKPQIGFEPSPQILSGAPQKIEDNHRSSADNDDDDLPEFDFGNAYGVSQLPDSRLLSSSHNHHAFDLPSHKQQLPAEVNKGASVAMPPEILSVRTMLAQDAPHRPHVQSSFGLRQNADQKDLLLKEVGVPAYGGWPSAQTSQPLSTLGHLETDKNSASPASKPFSAHKMVETIGQSSRPGASQTENSAREAAKSSFVQRRPIWDDDDMPEWCPPNLDDGQQLPSTSMLPPPLLSLPPPSMLPTSSRPSAPSPFLAPPSESVQSRSSMPSSPPDHFQLRYDRKFSHQHQSGILGRPPLENNPKIPMQTRPATRFSWSDWRASPEPNPNQAKRQRRISGWDVKPGEVKSDPWHGQSERR